MLDQSRERYWGSHGSGGKETTEDSLGELGLSSAGQESEEL